MQQIKVFAAIGLSVIVSGFSSQSSQAQGFDFKTDEFVKRFNAKLAADGSEPLEKCHTSAGETTCSFPNATFQKQVEGFRKLGVVTGQFENSERILISTDKGAVKMIIIQGTRGDPANLFSLIGDVQLIMKTLSKKDMSSDELFAKTKELGLMRGDSDPTIGEPRASKESFAVITCNNQPSSTSLTFGCAFIPPQAGNSE